VASRRKCRGRARRRDERRNVKKNQKLNFFRPLLFFCFPREAKKKKSFSISRKQALSKNLSFSPLLSFSTKKQQNNKRQFLVLGGWFSLSLSSLVFFLKVLSGKRESFRFVLLDHLFGLFRHCFLLPGERERKKEEQHEREETEEEQKTRNPLSLSRPARP